MYEFVLKSLKNGKGCYHGKYSKINKRKKYNPISEILTGVSRLAFGTSLSLTGVGSTINVPVASCSVFLASEAGLISDE